jgi:hypothetical protein
MKIEVLDTTLRGDEEERKTRVEKALKEFVSEMPKLRVKKVVLFGSTARGEDKEDSDVDLFIVGDRSERDRIVSIETDLDLKYNVPLVSVLQEKMTGDPSFIGNVLKEGRILYEQ